MTAAPSRPARPVKPRHSASLLLVRREKDGTYSVLMGRRPTRSRFMPDVYVFPGGGVETQDGKAQPLKPLAKPVATHLDIQPGPAAPVLADAAVRETWEETNLVMGDVTAGTLTPSHRPLALLGRAITPTDSPIRFHARFFMADASHAAGTPKSNGELLDLDWFPITEALKMPIIDVTELMLERAQLVLGGDRWPIQPVRFSYRYGKPYVVDDGAAYRFTP